MQLDGPSTNQSDKACDTCMYHVSSLVWFHAGEMAAWSEIFAVTAEMCFCLSLYSNIILIYIWSALPSLTIWPEFAALLDGPTDW